MIDHLAAVPVAKRSEPEDGGGQAERVAHGDEVEHRLRRVERLADGRQRDVGDRKVEVRDGRDHDQRQQDDLGVLGCRALYGGDPACGSMVRPGHRHTSIFVVVVGRQPGGRPTVETRWLSAGEAGSDCLLACDLVAIPSPTGSPTCRGRINGTGRTHLPWTEGRARCRDPGRASHAWTSRRACVLAAAARRSADTHPPAPSCSSARWSQDPKTEAHEERAGDGTPGAGSEA